MRFDKEKLLSEVQFKAVLSGGPGGQHANKTNTKIILEWPIGETDVFSEEEIARLEKNLRNRITKEGLIQLTCDDTRSQYQNKLIVSSRFIHIIKKGLQVSKPRKQPKPGRKFHEKRLSEKRKIAEKKENRKDPLT